MFIMTSSKAGELEDRRSATALLKEVDRLTKENSELAKLKQDNARLQERNIQLAAELSVKTKELEVALSRSKTDVGGSNESSDLSDVREHVVSTMPGDSYPAVAASLDDVDSDVNTDVEELENHNETGGKKQEPEYLLQKLKKGGNRMDQIKRQLVVQRGAIVAALKVLAQSRTSGSMSSFKSSEHSSASLVSEKDRVLVSITATESTSSCKLCPMCEAMFPVSADEEFEQHVMDHFSYDSDQDTLQYYDTHETEEDLQTDHL